MAPRNDPGKNDESPSQLRDAFRRANANVVDEEATEEESSNDDDDDERGPEASGYTPIPMTPPPPPSHREETEAEGEGEDNFADFDAGMARLESHQGQRRPEEAGRGELSPRVRSMAQADQWAHRREEARERLMVHASCPRASMEMDPAKVESIRRAMAGISLPESAVPKWAKEISDTEWHEMVTRKLDQHK